MTGPRRLNLAALYGTVAVAAWLAPEFTGLGSPAIDPNLVVIKNEGATFLTAYSQPAATPKPYTTGSDSAPAYVTLDGDALNERRDVAVSERPDGESVQRRDVPEPVPAKLATANPTDPLPSYSLQSANPLITPQALAPVITREDCGLSETCINDYLWSLYERAPKVDTVKERHKVKVTVKKKGKTRTALKTVVKFVDEDFAWKDPKAAQRFGIPLGHYVIGGMDKSFKLRLYRMLRAADEAGYEPGITSAFRDNYRQSIARGNKASDDSSYHGGSRRGGYGHGLAADLVSVKGATRVERWRSTEALWKWIDANGKEFGIGRPYLDRDPPHVGPIDGPEFLAKRGVRAKQARLEAKKQARLQAKKPARLEPKKQAQTKKQAPGHGDPKMTKPATTAKAAKVKSS